MKIAHGTQTGCVVFENQQESGGPSSVCPLAKTWGEQEFAMLNLMDRLFQLQDICYADEQISENWKNK